jgi:cohesin complex subunit SA-1/2
VIKQFLQHTESTVLSAAIQAINHLCNNSSMAGSNGTKLAQLEETLFTSLRDAIDGEDVFTMSLDEDRLAGLESILLRVVLLERSRDMVEVMEDVEGGQSSGWDIICAFAERGDVGYKEEAKVSIPNEAWLIADGRIRPANRLPAHDLALQAVHRE